MTVLANETDEIMDALKKMPQEYRGVLMGVMSPKMVYALRSLKSMVDNGVISRKQVLQLFK